MKLRAASLLLALAATLTPVAANATSNVAAASPTGKGIVGGALLGAEVVMVSEAAFKLKSPWMYIVGGVVGAAGGGVGGYFLEHNDSDARPSMLLLAGGVAFAIPTTVAVLSASNYEPPATFLQDQAPADEPIAEPPAPENMPAPSSAPPAPAPAPAANPDAAPTTPAPADGATPAPAPSGMRVAPTRHRVVRRWVRTPERLSLKLPPPALFGLTDSRLALGIPNIQLLHSYTRTERLVFGAPDVTELRIPVLDVTF